MPAQWITKSDGTEIRLSSGGDGQPRTYDLINDLRFQDADKTKVAAVLKDVLQADLEVVIRVRDLPDDEPAKAADPAAEYGERFFWRGRGANKDLVARATIIESVVWDGMAFQIKRRRAV